MAAQCPQQMQYAHLVTVSTRNITQLSELLLLSDLGKQ